MSLIHPSASKLFSIALICALPALAVDLNLQTLKGLTVNKVFQANTAVCSKILGQYVEGSNYETGLANDQSSTAQCGIGSTPNSVSPETAIDNLDHIFLSSDEIPTVLDFGSCQKTVVVFDAIIENPIPEKAIERTVWGSNSSDISNFPQGWTMATLNTIWKKGWTDPAICQPGPNSDDYSGQYTFAEEGFRFIALFADASVSIFNSRSYDTWNPLNDDRPNIPGWQSDTENTDAVGAPICGDNTIIANAGEDQEGTIGETICFSAANTQVAKGSSTVTLGWDLDNDGVIDLNDTVACIECDEVKTGELMLFATEQCGCADTDSVLFSCVPKEPVPEEPEPLPAIPNLPPDPGPAPIPILPPAIPPPLLVPPLEILDTSFPIFDPNQKFSFEQTPSDASKAIKPIYETRAIGCSSLQQGPFWTILLLLCLLRRRK